MTIFPLISGAPCRRLRGGKILTLRTASLVCLRFSAEMKDVLLMAST
jgi:hypothetical protein